ncbi:MAG: B12-binding domain-containing radical SAM protein [Isosphaeraceae bacterium]
MELPRRTKGDEYTPPGRYRELETRIQRAAAGKETPALFIYAFDQRTRLGPYIFVDKQLIPGAPIAIAAVLAAAGFENSRVVLQQWTPRIRPSRARLGGKPPELLLVSSMQIHSAAAYRLIDDAWSLAEDRPLIVAGGAKAVYEPWDFFGLGPDGQRGADVVVTGEEFVLLELLDRLIEFRGGRETWRQAFDRARASGALEDIPGLVYRRDPAPGPIRDLVNTGVQRLVQDLDELPFPLPALGMFERPHRGTALDSHAVAADRLGQYAKVLAIIMTHGCRFHCPYCPIHAYNQGTFRFRSPRRLVDEIASIRGRTGINSFFGTDDNFFNNHETAESILSALARGTVNGCRFRDAVWIGTEGTEHDVDRCGALMPLAREGGIRAIWFGIEDITGELVKKGQSPEKTQRVFRNLLSNGIAPMPMMMHHDAQPLWSLRGLYGLLNQIRYLKRAGAVSVQVTFLTPMVGSRSYNQAFEEGLVMRRVGGVDVADYQFDGNHTIASRSRHPWRKQVNVLVAYASFYNPLRILKALFTVDALWKFRIVYQILGNLGLLRSVWASRAWLHRLRWGRIEKATVHPAPKFRLVLPGEERSQLDNAGMGT